MLLSPGTQQNTLSRIILKMHPAGFFLGKNKLFVRLNHKAWRPISHQLIMFLHKKFRSWVHTTLLPQEEMNQNLGAKSKRPPIKRKGSSPARKMDSPHITSFFSSYKSEQSSQGCGSLLNPPHRISGYFF